MLLWNFTKLKKKQHEIMLNKLNRSLVIIWKTAIETWAQKKNGGPGNELGAWRSEPFPHLGNYTLTPVYNHRKWQLIGKSQWCCSTKCGHPLHVLTNNWTRGKQPANTRTPQSTTPGLHLVSIHEMAPPQWTSDLAHYSFIDHKRMKGW